MGGPVAATTGVGVQVARSGSRVAPCLSVGLAVAGGNGSWMEEGAPGVEN